jgi:nickel-dependent lactate racemase
VNDKSVYLPYGKRFISLQISPNRLLGLAESTKPKAISLARLISQSLQNFPGNSIKGKVLLVITDSTRKSHLREVLPQLLIRIQSKEISIITATGLHQPLDKKELKTLLGESIVERFKVYSHTPKKEELVYRGKTHQGVPIFLNKKLAETDSIISIGVIEPHLYAGYSGGAKTIAIGLAGEETINFTHHPRFLDRKGTALGSIKNNPFQNALWKIIRGLPIKYSLQIVNDAEGNFLKIFSGSLKATFREGVRFARKIFEIKLKEKADAVICGIGYPKDVNLYQASRAFNYILNTANPVVKKEGYVLVCAELNDGWGKGLGEKRFAEIMKNLKGPADYITKVKKSGCLAGEHRAYMVAKALTQARLGFIGEKAKLYCQNTPFLSFENFYEALRIILKKNPNSKFYIAPHALASIINQKGV